MEIKLTVAYITTEDTKKRMTKAIAKQFPIRGSQERAWKLESGKDVADPICKVRGKTLSSPFAWLYLVEDAEAGYAWQPAFVVREDYFASLRDKGLCADEPAKVPTVIL